MKLNKSKLANTFELMASTYAKRCGVTVRQQGTMAYTNGTQITIPRLDNSNEDLTRVALGYIAHESAHIKYTDFKIVKQAHKDEILFNIFNILEDVRIEILIGKEYVGVYENLALLAEDCVCKTLYELEKLNGKNVSILRYILGFVWAYGNAKLCKYKAFNRLVRWLFWKCHGKVDSDLLINLRHLIDDPWVYGTTEDSFKQAKRIYLLLLGKLPQHPEEQEQGSKQTEQKEDYEKNKEAWDQTYDAIKQGEGFEKFATPDSILTSNANEILSIKDDLGETKTAIAQEGSPDYGVDSTIVRPLASVIHSKLKAWVSSLSDPTQSGRKLDVYKAQTICCGNTDIFYRKDVEQDYSTSVTILTDLSGSMLSYASYKDKITRADVACQVALATCLGLDGIPDVKVQAIAFPGLKTETEYVKLFKEKASAVRARFDQRGRGATPLAQAIYVALNEIAQADCNRDIIIIVTDGVPDSMANAKRALELAKDYGVEVYGIGIECDLIKQIIPNSAILKSAKELPLVMGKLIKDLF